MLIFLKTFFVLIALNIFCLSTGNFFLREKYSSIFKVFFGFCFLLTFLNVTYFILLLNNVTIKLLTLIIFFLFIFLSRKKILSDYNLIFKLTIIPTIIFSFLIAFYGEQFFVFRGNHYDSINYSSLALTLTNFNYTQILEIFKNNNDYEKLGLPYLYLQNGIISFYLRPLASLFTSLFFHPALFEFYIANNIVKFFSLTLISISFFYLIDFLYPNLKNKIKILISNVFVISFWSLYIFEIDALSQLTSYALSIFIVTYLIQNYLIFIKNNYLKIFIFAFLCGNFFLIYLENAIVVFYHYIPFSLI